MRKVTPPRFDRQLLGAADVIRGKVDASKVGECLIGMLFLKRCSGVFDEGRADIMAGPWAAKRAWAEQRTETLDDLIAGRVLVTIADRTSLGRCGSVADRAMCVDAGRAQGGKPQTYCKYFKRFPTPGSACRRVQREASAFCRSVLGSKEFCASLGRSSSTRSALQVGWRGYGARA